MAHTQHASGMQTRALIIGVNTYDHLGDELKGAVADAIHWYGIARRMGIADKDITVLTSPALEPSALGGDEITCGSATRASIVAAVEQLAAAMDTQGGSKAMVTFSGHGGWSDARGALVAPSDVDGELDGALALGELEALLDTRADDTDVTFFVDACYRHRGGADGIGSLPTLRRRDVIFSACPPRSQSHELFVGGEWRGAFSWAVTSILDRWGPRAVGADPDFNLDYATLRDRAAALLRAVAVVQPPLVSGAALEPPRGVLSSRAAGAVDGRPSQGLVARQIPVGTDWRIKRPGGTEIGTVSATSSEQTWTWYTDEGSPFPDEDFELHSDTSSTPESGHTLDATTYENGSGFSEGSTAFSGAHYEVSGGSTDAHLRYDNTDQKLEWASDDSIPFSGTTITFTYQASGSVTGKYSEVDDAI